MTETDETRVANEQHQANAGDCIYEDKRQLANIKTVQTKRREQGSNSKQAVPEPLTVVFKEVDVLPVLCLEDETQNQYSCLDLLLLHGRENALRANEQHQDQNDVSTGVGESGRQIESRKLLDDSDQ